MIPVTLLDFHITPEPGLDTGRVSGSALRGGLYAALRTLYDTHQPVTSRDDWDTNPVGWLLRLEDTTTSGGKDVPRALAIRPFLDSDDRSFGLAFYGHARQTIQMVISVIPVMGSLGIGPGRQHFRLAEVNSVDPLTGQTSPLLNGTLQQIGYLPEPLDAAAYQQAAQSLPTDRLTVTFLTPTRIINQKHLTHTPVFRSWFQRLLERTRTISELYTDAPLWLPFHDLLTVADALTISRDDTCWVEGWSGSRRDGMVKPLGGFVGSVTYQGDVAPLLPYILLGQALQVGKNTIKGCGWYTIMPE